MRLAWTLMAALLAALALPTTATAAAPPPGPCELVQPCDPCGAAPALCRWFALGTSPDVCRLVHPCPPLPDPTRPIEPCELLPHAGPCLLPPIAPCQLLVCHQGA